MKRANSDLLVAGFSLIEAMATLALTATIILALSSVAGQWLPNWRRGFVDLQRADLLSVGLERVVDDLSAAEYVTRSAGPGAIVRRRRFIGDVRSIGYRSGRLSSSGSRASGGGQGGSRPRDGAHASALRADCAASAGRPGAGYRLRRSCHPRSRALPHFVRLCRTGPSLAFELERSGAVARGGADIGPGHDRQPGAGGVDRSSR